MTLESDIAISYRSECAAQATVPKRCNNLAGMVCRISDDCCVTAYTVSEAVDRKVAIRISNPSSSDIALHAGQEIAKFWPVVELTEKHNQHPPFEVAIIANLSLDMKKCSDLKEALSPSLIESNSRKIFDTLVSFLMSLTKG